jgi:hypothetical protein
MSASRGQGGRRLDQERARRQPVDAAEAVDQMGALDRQPVEVEILEIGVHGRDQIAVAVARLGAPRQPSPHGHALARERVLALVGAVEQQRRARVGGEISGVVGEVGEEQQGRAVVVGGDVCERHIGSALGGVQQRAKRGPRYGAHPMPCGGCRIGVGLSGHRLRSAVASAEANLARVTGSRCNPI